MSVKNELSHLWDKKARNRIFSQPVMRRIPVLLNKKYRI
jgi:hypothetical protein